MTRTDEIWIAVVGALACRAFYGLYKHLTYKPPEVESPRPPAVFADADRIKRINRDLYEDFLKRILGVPWAFISDESSLWDFNGEPTIKELQQKILDVYCVDVAEISDGNIATILERLATAGIKPSAVAPESQ